MPRQRVPGLELISTSIAAGLFAVSFAMVFEPMSKRPAALASGRIAARSACTGTHAHDATGLACLL